VPVTEELPALDGEPSHLDDDEGKHDHQHGERAASRDQHPVAPFRPARRLTLRRDLLAGALLPDPVRLAHRLSSKKGP